jgi:ornithine carbamoyltransferase
MDLLGLEDVDGKWIRGTLSDAAKIKSDIPRYGRRLEGKVLSMLFMKPSTRTRVSFEAGMYQLGGHAIYLDLRSTNFTKGALRDEARCVDRYSDIMLARVFRHQEVVDIAEAAEKPVINALCDREHPCQALADIMTLKEKLGTYKFRLAYIGDGNNVCNSLIYGCCKVGAEISVATPKGYEPDRDAVEYGLTRGLTLHREPKEAAKGADAVYTDVWVSMGQESEKKRRMKAFKGYGVGRDIRGGAYFMHCLPALRGYEVSDEVMDCPKSIVFDQAENRMHAQKALLLRLMGARV